MCWCANDKISIMMVKLFWTGFFVFSPWLLDSQDHSVPTSFDTYKYTNTAFLYEFTAVFIIVLTLAGEGSKGRKI